VPDEERAAQQQATAAGSQTFEEIALMTLVFCCDLHGADTQSEAELIENRKSTSGR
jgi:hypothetical protein